MQLTGFVIVLLMCAAVASIIVNATSPRKAEVLSYTTGMAIFLIVLINAGIAAYTENAAGDSLEALSKMTQASINVIRGGQEVRVDVPTIVKGDLVVLGTGDVVPADIRLVEADDVKVSEMALTGEPDDVSKTSKIKVKKDGEPEKLTPENMVFSGCSVTNGKGRGIVTSTGMDTRIGRIAQLINGEDGGKGKKSCGCLPDSSASATPLQRNLENLGARIGVLAVVVCVAIFIVGVAMDRRDPANPQGASWLYMILIAVTLAVAAIPEGIPLCVTISLSIGCKDMVTKNVLVRKLAAVETLGSASVICSDKTGTLTEGKMTMVGLWAGGIKYEVTGKGFDPTVGGVTREGSIVSACDELPVRSALLFALLCCNTKLEKVTDEETREERYEPRGNSSEAPIVVAAQKIGLGAQVAEAYPRVLEVPFSSSRKMMLTVSDVSGRNALCEGGMELGEEAKFLVVCKGAPNFIVEYCTERMSEDGKVEPMSEADQQAVLNVVDEYSSKALRVLAIATRTLEALPFDTEDEDVTTDEKFQACRTGLRLIGLVASIDPERDGVPESVALARGAGIRVVMITGDYVKTAVAIAKNVQILQACDDEEVAAVDCKSLRPGDDYLADADMDVLTKSIRVFARARPEDKLKIVQSLQRQGAVTAMTGDGVNDAPALNQANIGVAMGIQGTEVAKGASDMILTDDNFCSIVAAVEKGRAIYAGIQKFVAFIMSVHIAEVLQIFVCIVAGVPVMRTPLQILFLILVTDLPPSIALGMEPGESTILKDRPRPKDEPVVLGWMWVSMILNGVVLSGVIVAVYIASLMFYCQGNVLQADIDTLEVADRDAGLMNARTVAFISLVWSENVRSYTSRSFDRPVWRNIFGNRQMQKAIFLAQACLYVAVLVPFISDEILGLSGVTIRWEGWLIALAGPVGCLVLCELCKLITAVQMRQYQEKLARAAVAEAAPPAKAKGEDATKVSAPEPGFDFNSQNVIIEV
uniref:P-type sodium-transporting ATPase4 n=1 Tax=Zooxanthella nutricula TaxID=1333877 RepID=A0A7S2Q8H1_9DINO